jgi:hypothetical protein
MNLKMLIATITLLTSTMIFAKDIATYSFVLKGDQYGEYHSYEVALDHANEINVDVVTTIGAPPFYTQGEGEPTELSVSKKLSHLEMNLVQSKLIALSLAKITTKTTQFRCMMMPSPDMAVDILSVRRNYNNDYEMFMGKVQIVLSTQGCWADEHIFPTNEYDMKTGVSLKMILRTLAITLTADEL